MFKKTTRILKNIFSKTDQIEVSLGSQSHVLAARMAESGLKHNEKVLVDIKGVRVIKGKLEEDQPSDTTTMFFCPVEDIVIKKRVLPGDGGWISSILPVKLEGIKAPKPVFRKQEGMYNLKDVLLCANGRITIEATRLTKWVKV